MPHALILGGTGFVGRHVCEKLHRQGWTLTVPTRRAVNAATVQHLPRLTVVEADVHDPAALARLLPDHDAVVNLVAILHGSEAAFERTHVELPRKIAAACAASGVRRLVHISALGVAEDGPSRYQRSKARGEALLRAAGLDLTVLRPSVIFGNGDRFLNLFAQLQALFPVMPLAGAQARFQPVWVEDVALAVQRCLTLARDAASVEQRDQWLDEGLSQARRLLEVVVMLHQAVGTSALPSDLERTVVDVTQSLAVAYPRARCQVEDFANNEKFALFIFHEDEVAPFDRFNDKGVVERLLDEKLKRPSGRRRLPSMSSRKIFSFKKPKTFAAIARFSGSSSE